MYLCNVCTSVFVYSICVYQSGGQQAESAKCPAKWPGWGRVAHSSLKELFHPGCGACGRSSAEPIHIGHLLSLGGSASD